ncbi:MAG TPA: hypothetical protein VGP41_13440 [Candidatus Lustribacter sp.]|jgi:hypothetical protein|nr:hypothetical protein [Candidatus Lustribacter sp.]
MRAYARAAFCITAAAFALLAATPAPFPTPVRVDLTKVQPKSLLPKVPLHTEFIVAVNKLGQVTHIVSGKPSKDRDYNLHTAGNALQAFIRTPDGKAISGTYKLTYDYNPKTERVHRDVALIKAGGVNPNEEGAVNKMVEDVQKHAKTATPAPERPAAMTPGPQPTGTVKLPGLGQILKSPAP